jgi:hypothetical protein
MPTKPTTQKVAKPTTPTKKGASPVKKVATKGEKKVHKSKPAPIAGPAKPVSQRQPEDWVSVGLQSSTKDKKYAPEKILKEWLASHYSEAQGEEGKKFLKRQLPKLLVKLLGDGLVSQYKGKWRVSQKGLVKFGDISKK